MRPSLAHNLSQCFSQCSLHYSLQNCGDCDRSLVRNAGWERQLWLTDWRWSCCLALYGRPPSPVSSFYLPDISPSRLASAVLTGAARRQQVCRTVNSGVEWSGGWLAGGGGKRSPALSVWDGAARLSQPAGSSLLPPVLVLSLTTRLYYPTLSRLQLPHSKYHGITACPALHSLLESNSM